MHWEQVCSHCLGAANVTGLIGPCDVVVPRLSLLKGGNICRLNLNKITTPPAHTDGLWQQLGHNLASNLVETSTSGHSHARF